MVDSKFFGIPFAASGDKATIPEDTQPSGAISYQQGYGPDYERDPATDPLAKRVPRDETNELYFQITNTLRFLQLYGAPEWYALDDNGDPVAYPLTARVRHDAGAGMRVWRSLIAANTTVPGADPAHWTLDEPYSTAALESSLAQALAGTGSSTLITPRRLASSVQQGVWNYAAATGTPNALTATLSPAPASISAGMRIWVLPSAVNTGAATLDLNGLGASSILDDAGQALSAGDIQQRATELIYISGAWRLTEKPGGALSRVITAATAGAGTYTPSAGTRRIIVRGQGGGGAGGGCPATGAGAAAAGGGGTCGAFGFKEIQNPVTTNYVVGAAGVAAAGANGGGGGATTFGGVLTLPGGGGGGVGVAATGASSNGPYLFSANPTGADQGSRGQGGGFGVTVSAASAIGGGGGSSQYGSGGSYAGTNGTGVTNGVAAAGNGAGGGGASAVNSGVAAIGGNGAPGILIIEEYV